MTKTHSPMLDRSNLIQRIEAGEKFDFLCFYGHAVHSPVSKTCFSQWYPAPFKVDGVIYPTAEHWMMAGKARLFGDDDALQRILVAPDPKSAKAIGREVRGFDDKVWKANCRRLVTEGNVHKFSQNEELRKFLLSTGDSVLVEAAPRDQIWGIGLGQDNHKARDPKQWRGQNLLGFALMDVRERLNVKSTWPKTRWDLIAIAGDPSSALQRESLRILCEAYRPALHHYSVLRNNGNLEDANDATQGFFLKLLSENTFARVSQGRARFRTFLVHAFDNYLIDEHRKRSTRAIVTIDSEKVAEQIDHRETVLTPLEAYYKAFAKQLIALALLRISSDPLFPHLKGYLGFEKEGAYAEIAAKLKVSEASLRKVTSRLKEAFQEELRLQLRQIVSDCDVEDEMRNLWHYLSL